MCLPVRIYNVPKRGFGVFGGNRAPSIQRIIPTKRWRANNCNTILMHPSNDKKIKNVLCLQSL